MTQIGLQSIAKDKLEEEWVDGANTYLGTTVPNYPNMFHIYGVHGPTLLANGPTAVEIQGRWVTDMITKMERENIKYVNPKPEAAKQWKTELVALNDMTLLPTTTSTYMGGNKPGKKIEPMCWTGGIPKYSKAIRGALDSMEGFEVVKN
jgi:hypothetical protein